MTAIRGYSRLAPLVVVALMLTVAGCSLGSSSQSSDQGSHTQNGNSGSASGSQARASSTQWSKYFPAEEGRVCTYYNSIHVENVLDIPSNDITAETKQKLKYTDVHRESDGTHFAIKRSGNVVATTESQDSASGRQTIPITARTYKYVLDDDGTVHAEPQVFSGQGVEASFDKFVVYPSIEDLKQGKSTSTSVTGKVRASNPETQAQLEKQLPSGQSAMKMRMEYTVTGVPPKEITTPAGKFTDVIGLSIKLKDVEALNANPEGDRQIDTLASVLTEVTGTDTIWFARDVGLVQAQKKGSFAASFLEGASTSGGDTSAGDSSGSAIPPLELQGCNGEASSEPTTEGSQPSSPEPEPTTDPETATPSGSQDPNTASSRDNGVDSDTGGDTGSSDDSGDSGEGSEQSETESGGASLEQTVENYHLAAGANEWGETYQYLDSGTQDAISKEQWTKRNQFLFERNPVIYHIESIEREGDSADVTLRISEEDGTFIMNEVVRFVLEDGSWKYSPSASELESLMYTATYEEFVKAKTGTSSEGTSPEATEQQAGFERFVGEWYRHGEALTVNSDQTGSGVSRIYSTPNGETCPPDRSKCNVKFELSFTPTDNGIEAEITSIEDGEYADLEVGDTYSLKLVDDNLLRQSNRGEVGGYWCNSQTSDENRLECGA